MRGVVAEGLVKRFGTFTALAGVDFVVPEGKLVGLLGPNGAGKTTTIRILTTLLPLDEGRATVHGYDVMTDSQLVRSVIGLTGQYAAVDADLTGRENLVLVGRLGRMTRREAIDRSDRLLTLFELSAAGDRASRTYSGGMRRRLDVAASLMVAPSVLFLDEPTTGLDPRSRISLWDLITELKDGGTTIVLTTQYLEEADRLADSISVIDVGRIIAEGTADELKRVVGGDVLHLQVEDRATIGNLVSTLGRAFGVPENEFAVDLKVGTIALPVTMGAAALTRALRALDADGIEFDDISLRRPSLDDVFLNLTGHQTDGADPRPEQPEPRPMFAGRQD